MLLERLVRRAAAIVIVCLFGTNVSYVAAGDFPPPTNGISQLGGWVYIDKNNDGEINFATHTTPEWMIGGVRIELFAGDSTTPLITHTNANGRYFFPSLLPGTYRLREVQPIEFVDGIDSPGSVFSAATPEGAPSGTVVEDGFNFIELTANSRGDYYNFGERGWALGYASKRFLEGFEPVMEFGEDAPAFVFVPEPTTFLLIAMAVGLLPRRRRRH